MYHPNQIWAPAPAPTLGDRPAAITDERSEFLPETTLDERSDHAQAALDAYTDCGGTTGSDRQDIRELITDLLHLLDDLELRSGERDDPPALVLADALTDYRRDLSSED